MAKDAKKCIIGYAETFVDGRPYGDQPDPEGTVYCCPEMQDVAIDGAGNDIFNYSHPFQLLKRGDLKCMLNQSREAKFCPFCGAPIEVKKTANMKLREKIKRVNEGYETVTRTAVS